MTLSGEIQMAVMNVLATFNLEEDCKFRSVMTRKEPNGAGFLANIASVNAENTRFVERAKLGIILLRPIGNLPML